MLKYKIEKLNDSLFNCIIVFFNYDSIMNHINQIESELDNLIEIILIDRLLTTGDNENRYISCKVNNSKILLETAQTVIPNEEIVNISDKILRQYPKELEKSILCQSLKEKILYD